MPRIRARWIGWLLLIGIALHALVPGGEGPLVASEARAKEAAERESLVSLARLEPASGVVNVAAGASDVVRQVLVQDGSEVTESQVLVLLESYELRAAELDAARIELERADLGPLEIEAQKARIRAVQAELDYAKDEVSSQEGLSEKGFSAGKEFREAQLQVLRAEEQLNESNALLERRIANLDLARREAENRVQQAEARLEQTMIRSPLNGRVLRVRIREGERVDQNPVVSIAATQTMMAVAEVHANEIRLVRVGQRAVFSSPALPDALSGQVDSVGQMIFSNNVIGEDPTAPRGLRVVEVRVRLEPNELARKMTHLEGQLRIHLEDREQP
jgi:HlyD family secretion protein